MANRCPQLSQTTVSKAFVAASESTELRKRLATMLVFTTVALAADRGFRHVRRPEIRRAVPAVWLRSQ